MDSLSSKILREVERIFKIDSTFDAGERCVLYEVRNRFSIMVQELEGLLSSEKVSKASVKTCLTSIEDIRAEAWGLTFAIKVTEETAPITQDLIYKAKCALLEPGERMVTTEGMII